MTSKGVFRSNAFSFMVTFAFVAGRVVLTVKSEDDVGESILGHPDVKFPRQHELLENALSAIPESTTVWFRHLF